METRKRENDSHALTLNHSNESAKNNVNPSTGGGITSYEDDEEEDETDNLSDNSASGNKGYFDPPLEYYRFYYND